MQPMGDIEFVDLLESFWQSKQQATGDFRIGTVTAVVSGNPRILFDGDDDDGGILYPVMKSYSPVVAERVFAIRFGSSYVVIGAIKTA